jgi:hypothetical protein
MPRPEGSPRDQPLIPHSGPANGRKKPPVTTARPAPAHRGKPPIPGRSLHSDYLDAPRLLRMDRARLIRLAEDEGAFARPAGSPPAAPAPPPSSAPPGSPPRTYQLAAIPGLLQTKKYAVALNTPWQVIDGGRTP